MSGERPASVRDRRTAIRRAAVALVERAEQRATTCGGKPHEWVTPQEYEALKQLVAKRSR